MRRSRLRSALLVAGLALGAAALPATAFAAKGRNTADRLAPSVAIGSPATGASVGSPVTVTGSAYDDRSVAKVMVAVDGATPTTASGTATWSWVSPSLAAGAHTVRATAYDTSGNTLSTSISVTVTAPATTAPDTTAPSVAITSPTANTSVGSSVTVAGSAADDRGLSSVQVRVDSGALSPATGTSSWTATLDTAGWTSGDHTVTAQAIDTAGNVQSATLHLSKSATVVTSGPDIALNDPSATSPLILLSPHSGATLGSRSVVLSIESGTSHFSLFTRDSATGDSSYLALPLDDTTGWSNAAVALTGPNDVWIAGGMGPLVVRHYVLSGTPAPTSATLVSRQSFGTTDSRQGDLLALADGALAFTWHQQGVSGAEGGWISYLAPGSTTWQSPLALDLGATAASKEVLAQHPADSSVWVFSQADGSGVLAVARLTDSAGKLTLAWTDPTYLSTTKYGNDAPDPENPDIEAVPDPSTGTIVLAYQSAERVMHSTGSGVVTGSYPVVARFPANGTPSFTVLPVYVERITILGLSVRPGKVWLSYRPLDATTLTFDQLETRVLTSSGWSSATAWGQTYSGYEASIGAGTLPQITVRMKDGRLHQFLLS